MADSYVSEIRAFTGQYAPVGFVMCDGSMLSVNTYQLLFAVIGTTYGGNGLTTFGVPDLRGRIPIGQGQGTGLTNRPMGSSAGTETETIVEAQLPVHTHSFVVSTVPANISASTNAPSGSTSYLGVASSPAGTGVAYVPVTATNGATVKALSANVLVPAGGSGAHNNMMPYMALNYIICVNGIFPQKP